MAKVVLTVAVVAVMLLAGCSGEPRGDDTVTGVVTQVSGPGDSVTSFVILDANGSSRVFVPAEGLTCGGEPLNHLREHLLRREEVTVRFTPAESGPPVAIAIDHRD